VLSQRARHYDILITVRYGAISNKVSLALWVDGMFYLMINSS